MRYDYKYLHDENLINWAVFWNERFECTVELRTVLSIIFSHDYSVHELDWEDDN